MVARTTSRWSVLLVVLGLVACAPSPRDIDLAVLPPAWQVTFHHWYATPSLPPPWQELLECPLRPASAAAQELAATDPLRFIPGVEPAQEEGTEEPTEVVAVGPDLDVRIAPETVARVLADDEESLQSAVTALYDGRERRPLFMDPHYGSAPINHFLHFLLATHELGLDPFDFRLQKVVSLTRGNCGVHFHADGDPTIGELEALLHRFVPEVPPPYLTMECRKEWWPGDEAARELDVRLARAWVLLSRTLGLAEAPFPGVELAVHTLVTHLPRNERFAGRVAALRKFLPYWGRGGFPTLGRWGGLRKGDFGPRVARLKRRLVVEGYLDEAAAAGHWKTFDAATREAVVAYRNAYGLRDKGLVDHAMLNHLSHEAEVYVKELQRSLHETLVAGRERGEDYILVNIPEFTTSLVLEGRVAATYRSVVGFPYEEPGGRTPELSGVVAYVDLNPTWTPTPYVLEKELQPKQHKDKGYFARHHFAQRNGKWIQLPGPHNTLGQVVIGFPNENLVSLHGTNDPEPFGFADRALSHGCIRVEGIEELARRVLAWSGDLAGLDLERIFAQVVERRVEPRRALPIHIIYDRVRVVSGHTIGLTPDPYKLGRRRLRSVKLDNMVRLVTMARKSRRLASR